MIFSGNRLKATYRRMAKPHPFFLLVWLLFSPSASSASSEFNTRVSQAYTETIRLQITNGRSQLKQELQRHPSNAVALLVANQQDFLTLCIQQDPKAYDSLIKAQENRLLVISGLKERSPWVDYSIAEVRLHIALSKLLFDHKLAAAWELRQAYLQFVTNAKRYPSFLPNKKSLGALQVLIGSVPDSYQVFLNIIGMKGSIKTGMANLKTAATQEHPFQQEAVVLHALLEHMLEQGNNKTAEATLTKLAKSEPDNLLFSFVALHILKKNKQSEQALQVYQHRPTGPAYITFPYLHHMAADLYLYKGSFTSSIRENELFLKQHKGEHYLKAAHFKLYQAHWLNKSGKQADHHYNLIKLVGKSVVEEDAYALRFTDGQTQPNQYLLLARLQSDGGYYREALTVLQQMKLQEATPKAEKAEYYYRKARIHHGLEDISQAKHCYEQAISASKNSTFYFAPYASLQLGYLYQEENNKEKATAYFKKALNYKGHEYKNSIDAKAKLALLIL
jgi:hypothetical protein